MWKAGFIRLFAGPCGQQDTQGQRNGATEGAVGLFEPVSLGCLFWSWPYSKEMERGTEREEQNREQKGKYWSSLLWEEEACVGIMWQGFGSRGAAGVVSVRSPAAAPR